MAKRRPRKRERGLVVVARRVESFVVYTLHYSKIIPNATVSDEIICYTTVMYTIYTIFIINGHDFQLENYNNYATCCLHTLSYFPNDRTRKYKMQIIKQHTVDNSKGSNQ